MRVAGYTGTNAMYNGLFYLYNDHLGSNSRTTYTIAGQAVAQKEKGLALGENFDDDNSTGWTAHAGTWAISNTSNVGSSYRQSNSTHTATNSSRALNQSGSMAFEWEVYCQRAQVELFLSGRNINLSPC